MLLNATELAFIFTKASASAALAVISSVSDGATSANTDTKDAHAEVLGYDEDAGIMDFAEGIDAECFESSSEEVGQSSSEEVGRRIVADADDVSSHKNIKLHGHMVYFIMRFGWKKDLSHCHQINNENCVYYRVNRNQRGLELAAKVLDQVINRREEHDGDANDNIEDESEISTGAL